MYRSHQLCNRSWEKPSLSYSLKCPFEYFSSCFFSFGHLQLSCRFFLDILVKHNQKKPAVCAVKIRLSYSDTNRDKELKPKTLLLISTSAYEKRKEKNPSKKSDAQRCTVRMCSTLSNQSNITSTVRQLTRCVHVFVWTSFIMTLR